MYIACLMAGKSSRLLPRTRVDHKAMLKVGQRRIIDAQLHTFTRAGIETASFVVGHGGARLAGYLLANYSRLPITIINNTHFNTRNLDWSAYLALRSSHGDVIYYEGDLVLAPSIIRELARHKGDVCVAMDPEGRSAKIDTRVYGYNGRARELRWSEHGDLGPTSGSSGGEFICSIKLSNRARTYVLECLSTQSYIGPIKLYSIFNQMFDRFQSHLISTSGRPWVEIDNEVDLRRASQVVDTILQSEM